MTTREQVMETDILVVGGGMAGAAVAAELAAHRRVLLLEQEAMPGYHATGRSAALLSEIYGNASVRALTRASRDFLLSSEQSVTFASHRPSIYIATHEQLDNLEAFIVLGQNGQNLVRLSGDEARSRLPLLRPGHVAAAALELHSYDLSVNDIHQFYLRKLKSCGGQINCGRAVTSARYENSGWIVAAGEHVIRASIIVNAAGAWGDVLAKACGIAPIGLAPKKRTVVLVKAAAHIDPSPWPTVIDIGEQFYFKPDAGLILMSPADETSADPGDAYADEYDVAVAIDRVQQAVDIPIERVTSSWAGLRTFVSDRTPVVGFDEISPRFFWLVGQGGYGIQTAPALARLAAALVLDQAPPADVIDAGVDLACLRPGRPSLA